MSGPKLFSGPTLFLDPGWGPGLAGAGPGETRAGPDPVPGWTPGATRAGRDPGRVDPGPGSGPGGTRAGTRAEWYPAAFCLGLHVSNVWEQLLDFHRIATYEYIHV